MNEVDNPTKDVVGVDQFGQGFAAGCRLLRSRYHLSEEASLLITATIVATAIGPAVRIRHPLGGDLPLSLHITFCATSQSPISAALSDAFRVFREVIGQKAVWRENVGSRKLRADFLATLTALEAVEQQIRHATPAPAPAASAGFLSLDQDEILRRSKLERENRLAHRDVLRAELSERRMDMAPFLVAEDPGWDTILALDKLAFDNCLTSISPDGAALRELFVSTPKQLSKIARLVQASRRGHSLTDGPSILLYPVLVALHVASPELLAAAVKNRSVREGGFLQGAILEVAQNHAAFDAAAFVDASDEQRWTEFISGLFARRIRDYPQLYMLDERGFSILENFRQWCLHTGAERPGLAEETRVILEGDACLLPAGSFSVTEVPPTAIGSAEILYIFFGDQAVRRCFGDLAEVERLSLAMADMEAAGGGPFEDPLRKLDVHRADCPDALIEWSITASETKTEEIQRRISGDRNNQYIFQGIRRENRYILLYAWFQRISSMADFNSSGGTPRHEVYPITSFARAHLWKYLFDHYDEVKTLADDYRTMMKDEAEKANSLSEDKAREAQALEQARINREEAVRAAEQSRLDRLFPVPWQSPATDRK